MAKFTAGTAVEALDYDFTDYVPGCAGTIPEPTTEQIETYFDRAREVAQEVMAVKNKMDKVKNADGDGSTENLTEEEVTEIVTDLEEIDVHGLQAKMVDLIADLCSQQPTAEQITALPFRVRQAFIKWVGSQFRS